MASEVWLGLSARERTLLREALAAYAKNGNAQAAFALARKIQEAKALSEDGFAYLVTGKERIVLTKEEYGEFESGLEWRIADLDEAAGAEKPFDREQYVELRAEAEMADKVWGAFDARGGRLIHGRLNCRREEWRRNSGLD